MAALVRRAPQRSVSIGLTVAVVASLLVGLVTEAHPAAAAVSNQQVAVPSYIPPNGDPDAWNRLVQSNSNKVGIVVANVANGPDFQAKAMWADVMGRSHQSGKRVLGYVDTGYMGLTKQSTRLGSTLSADWIVQIEQDINRWYALYPGMVDGIFFDQGFNACGVNNAYSALYDFVNEFEKRNHPGSMTVLNPGAVVPQCYEDSADVLLTYESSYEGYMLRADTGDDLNFHTPNWTPSDPHKFWHIIYGVATNQVAAVIATSRARNAGYVYVTDDVMVNPYDTLPKGDFWSTEQNSVSGGAVPPEPALPRAVKKGGAPAAPGGVRLTAVDYTSARVSWSDVSSADSYRININGVYAASVPSDATTATLGTLAPGARTYSITVQAEDSAGVLSVPSSAVTAVTKVMPDDQTVVNPRVATVGSTISYSADYLAPYSFHRVFIGSSTPNLNCWKTPIARHCAVWAIEGHFLYRYAGDATGTQWSWTMVRNNIDPVIKNYTYTWTVNSADMVGGTDDITISGDGYGPLTYLNASNGATGSPAKILAEVAIAFVVSPVAAVIVVVGNIPPPGSVTPVGPVDPNPPPARPGDLPTVDANGDVRMDFVAALAEARVVGVTAEMTAAQLTEAALPEAAGFEISGGPVTLAVAAYVLAMKYDLEYLPELSGCAMASTNGMAFAQCYNQFVNLMHDDQAKSLSYTASGFRAAAGGTLNDGCEAHHIVAQEDPRAQPARDILAAPDIKIGKHDPRNSALIGNRGHAALHTKIYYDAINAVMKKTVDAARRGPDVTLGPRRAVLDQLEDLQQALERMYPC